VCVCVCVLLIVIVGCAYFTDLLTDNVVQWCIQYQ